MKSMLYLLGLLSVSQLFSCKNESIAKGVIFERRHIDNNTLQIKYHYKAGESQYIDSATIDNNIIRSDSISVKFDPKNPSKTFVDLKK